ncbi:MULTISPECIES: hypothetical protein [unclassified Dyella]|jgi:hypothetical protein|uniref:hypothetical protein n=1 Tax=unclassified Dyella TaxID=2634549 RepID=UPI003F8F6D8F
MQRLSSRSTFFFKRVFPAFWFGFLALWTVVWAGSALVTHDMKMLAVLPGPLIMALFGYALFKWLLFGLVDEVWLEGDQLLVRNRGEQSRVPLANVTNVNATVMVSPPRITLSLRQESPVLGKDISFMPIGRTSLLAAFKPSPIAAELIQRIDSVRQRRPA